MYVTGRADRIENLQCLTGLVSSNLTRSAKLDANPFDPEPLLVNVGILDANLMIDAQPGGTPTSFASIASTSATKLGMK